MAKLKDKMQDALDELRMLVLGLQVLVGFGFRAVFEPGFAQLSPGMQLAKLVALSLLLLALGLVMTPGAVHRLGMRGEDSPRFHRFVTGFADVALLPFAVALALDVATAASRTVAQQRWAFLVAAGAGAVALAMWYGLELTARMKIAMKDALEDGNSKAETKDKIRHVLTEARVVLPGAQALLGFQLVTTLMGGFAKLPQPLKTLHLVSLSAVALATILLMTPAAWHRLVERGELTERFHRFASVMVVLALVPLAVGLVGDFYIVADQITRSPAWATALSVALAVVFALLWFGIGVAWRLARSSPARPVALDQRSHPQPLG